MHEISFSFLTNASSACLAGLDRLFDPSPIDSLLQKHKLWRVTYTSEYESTQSGQPLSRKFENPIQIAYSRLGPRHPPTTCSTSSFPDRPHGPTPPKQAGGGSAVHLDAHDSVGPAPPPYPRRLGSGPPACAVALPARDKAAGLRCKRRKQRQQRRQQQWRRVRRRSPRTGKDTGAMCDGSDGGGGGGGGGGGWQSAGPSQAVLGHVPWIGRRRRRRRQEAGWPPRGAARRLSR